MLKLCTILIGQVEIVSLACLFASNHPSTNCQVTQNQVDQ